MTDRYASKPPGWSEWQGWRRLAKWGGVFFLGLIYFPLFWLALMSISFNPLSGIPYPLSLEHYKALVTDPRWLWPFAASLVIATLVGLICALSATLVGRELPKSRHAGRILLFCVLPLFVPGMSMGAARWPSISISTVVMANAWLALRCDARLRRAKLWISSVCNQIRLKGVSRHQCRQTKRSFGSSCE